MIKTSLIVCALILKGLFVDGQSNEAIINQIKIDFQKINTDTTLTSIKLTGEEIPIKTTDGGGELIGYFKGDIVSKIVFSSGVSYGMKNSEYYFTDGKLFFVYEEEKDYPVSKDGQSLDFNRLVTEFEGRYYINNEKLIDVKSKGQKRFERKSISSVKMLHMNSSHWMRIIKNYLKKKK